ncbi:NAD-dependent epimerase/dehydratase family protein [Alphaproteobacteria bacterium KMM 3653]|uniref:NAD-dependent epimerase/dehydratase family protein n=1 Tax=Harenicola maris TaxID=2841044 RepID=A0AAP2CND5_9RHOB|nr:NAD-dependent epimerase/dehydratase family protein [Harenicola maris]
MLLVTGAGGHTARYFFERLSAEGYQGKIRAVFRSEAGAEGFSYPALDIEKVYGDISRADTCRRILPGVETVLHIASIRLSKRIVTIGRNKGVQWFILIHTTARYSKHRMAFAAYAAIEDGLLERPDDLTILRPTMIYGSAMDKNMSRLIALLSRTPVFPVFGAGRALMQPVYAPDLARAYWQVMQNRDVTRGRAYNLPGREALPYRRILALVAKALNRRILFLPVPIAPTAWLARKLGKRSPVTEEQVLRLGEDKNFDWAAAARDFGYDPTAFEEGITAQVANRPKP